MVDYQTRQELNALSKEVFGSSSRWQKLVNNGTSQLVTEEVTELVPSEKEGEEPTERKVKVPVKRADGALQYVVKRYSVEEAKELMLDLKKKQEEFRAMIAKMQEEQRQKEENERLQKTVQEEVGGSAL